MPFIGLSHPEGHTLLSDAANVPTEWAPGPEELRPWPSAVAGAQQGWRGVVEGGGKDHSVLLCFTLRSCFCIFFIFFEAWI